MVVLRDSYMGMFLPQDIAARITNFMTGDLMFPFIKKDEIMATFYLFGKDKGVTGDREAQMVVELAEKTVHKVSTDITIFSNMRNRLSTHFVLQEYTKRALQISIEIQNESSFHSCPINIRIATDPTILSACFSHHIAYYNHDYFFELMGPFTESKIPKILLKKLQGRMLLLGYNTTGAESLPFKNTLLPFLDWMRKPG